LNTQPSRHSMIGSRVRRATCIAIAAVTGAGSIATAALAGGGHLEVALTDATAQPPAVFVSVSPLRVLDTRPAPNGPIGLAIAGKLGQGTTIDVQLAGDGKAVPAAATAAFLNITLDDDASMPSFLTVWPTGEPRPLSSANNALPGMVASNAMLAKLGTNGSVSIFNQQGAVNVVVDVVGYLVPLASAQSSGPQLLSGAGAPSNTIGIDGDFYVDTTTGVLYGPKASGVWPTPGTKLGGVQGAASAFTTAPATVLAPTTAGAPVSFDTAGPADGSVTRTNATTFTVSDSGLFTVNYNLGLSSSALGSIRVAVDGTPTGPASPLTVLVTGVSNSVLVQASAGDTIQLLFVPTVAGSSIGLTSASVVVEQATSA
jgi:hypothetical protein